MARLTNKRIVPRRKHSGNASTGNATARAAAIREALAGADSGRTFQEREAAKRTLSKGEFRADR